MSQPRRRRRRRRKSPSSSDQSQSPEQKQKQQPSQQKAGSGRRRRRRGRARGESRPASPKSSEDLVRALPKEPPASLTAPADGQSLEGIIGELQSQYGVPQYPQEYRITIKVADERDRSEPQPQKQPAEQNTGGDGQPKREKAPAAPLLMRGGETGAPSQNKRRRRGRRGRRRRGGGNGSGPSGNAGGNGSGPSEGGGGSPPSSDA